MWCSREKTGQHESDRGEERTVATAIRNKEERDAGLALQRQHTGE